VFTGSSRLGSALTGVLAIGVGGALVPTISRAESATIQVDIAAMEPGLALNAFSFLRTGNGSAGEWRVLVDPTAAAQKAIVQTSKDTTDYRFPLATRDDYYVVRANALEDNIRFYRVVNCRREQIEGVDTNVVGNAWHTLGLRAEGERFSVSFGGITLLTTEDKTFANSGKVALWTKADSMTHFDTISITPLD
jgi:hypothetical protein